MEEPIANKLPSHLRKLSRFCEAANDLSIFSPSGQILSKGPRFFGGPRDQLGQPVQLVQLGIGVFGSNGPEQSVESPEPRSWLSSLDYQPLAPDITLAESLAQFLQESLGHHVSTYYRRGAEFAEDMNRCWTPMEGEVQVGCLQFDWPKMAMVYVGRHLDFGTPGKSEFNLSRSR